MFKILPTPLSIRTFLLDSFNDVYDSLKIIDTQSPHMTSKIGIVVWYNLYKYKGSVTTKYRKNTVIIIYFPDGMKMQLLY